MCFRPGITTFYSISYQYFGPIGMLSCILIALLASALTGECHQLICIQIVGVNIPVLLMLFAVWDRDIIEESNLTSGYSLIFAKWAHITIEIWPRAYLIERFYSICLKCMFFFPRHWWMAPGSLPRAGRFNSFGHQNFIPFVVFIYQGVAARPMKLIPDTSPRYGITCAAASRNLVDGCFDIKFINVRIITR